MLPGRPTPVRLEARAPGTAVARMHINRAREGCRKAVDIGFELLTSFVLWILILAPMVTKAFSVILVFLALSPFSAPFQTTGEGEHQIAQVEPLSAIRQDRASRAVIAQRSEEVDASAPVYFSGQTALIASSDSAGGVALGTYRSALAKDYSPLVTILRL